MVSHLEEELQLNSLEAPDELQVNTVTQQATQRSPKKSIPTCNACKIPVTIETSAFNSNEAQNNTNSAGNNNNSKNVAQKNSNSIYKIPNNTNTIYTSNQKDTKPRPVYLPCELCAKTNHSTENCS